MNNGIRGSTRIVSLPVRLPPAPAGMEVAKQRCGPLRDCEAIESPRILTNGCIVGFGWQMRVAMVGYDSSLRLFFRIVAKVKNEALVRKGKLKRTGLLWALTDQCATMRLNYRGFIFIVRTGLARDL